MRRALESPEPGASNGGPNFFFRQFGAVLAVSEVAGLPRNLNLESRSSNLWAKIQDSGRYCDFMSHQITPKVSENKVCPPLDAPESELSS